MSAIPLLAVMLFGAGRAAVVAQAGGQEAFRAETDVVLLDASVTRPDGSPVLGLGADDFLVREDGVPRTLTFFRGLSQSSPTPLSAVLVIDQSSSMEGAPLEGARAAALSFIEESPETTEIAVLSFDREAHHLSGFTHDRAALASAVRALRPDGGTALYDALLAAHHLLENAKNKRRAIVLETDGCDLDSRAGFQDVARALDGGEEAVYAVGRYEASTRALYLTGRKYYKPPSFDENLNPAWVLRRLAESTGGLALFPGPGEPVAPLFEEIARRLRHQYLLGFDPGDGVSGGTGTPRFRRLDVTLRPGLGNGGPYVVSARRGYVR